MDTHNTSPEPFDDSENTYVPYTWQPQDDMTSRVSQSPSSITSSPGSGSDYNPDPNTGTSTPTQARQSYNYNVPTSPIRLPEDSADLVALKAELDAQPKIKDLLEKFDKDLQLGKMRLLLEEAEMALVKGDADRGEEKTQQGLDIAVELSDEMYLERCRMLMEWARNATEEGKVKGDGEWEDGGFDEEAGEGREDEGNMVGLGEDDAENQLHHEPSGESREGVSFSRGTSTSPGDGPGELLGEFLEGEGLEDADWHFADNEHSEAGTEDRAEQDEADDEDDSQFLHEYDPRNRPQTPVPPMLPTSDDDDEELSHPQPNSSLNPKQARRQFIERSNAWHLDTNPSQDEYRYNSEYTRPFSSPPSQFSYHDSDSGNGEEDYLDLILEPDLDSSSDEEESLSRKITRKRKMPTIADTSLFYTYLHRPNRKSKSRSKPRFQIGNTATSTDNDTGRDIYTGMPTPKPWHIPSSALDKQDYRSVPDPTLFWHTHSNTLLLRSKPPSQTQSLDLIPSDKISTLDIGSPIMPWLTAYNSTPVPPLSKSKFTFRKRLPVSEMACRVRSTQLFPEQNWEFIPLKSDWDAFVREGMEKVSMRFLAWERERISDLVREKRRRWDWSLDWRVRFGTGDGPWVDLDIDWNWIREWSLRWDGVNFGLLMGIATVILLVILFYLGSY
ncbi:uncharacterized protein BDV17DRAFT_287317 [Aspergillus undulatus]|uniref:uncharacterized protein n=1 Tax=Aspergillus undulatus TaxID=1810928 RepID=UPI003CCD6B75